MIKKISHIIIACLILVSTTGFIINMHYCHDQLIDLALFSPAHSCCDAGTEGQCHSDGDISKMNHCKDESIVTETTDEFVGSSFSFNLENTSSIDLLFTASILFNIQGFGDEIATEVPWHKEPPPYKEVVLSQIQAYLI